MKTDTYLLATRSAIAKAHIVSRSDGEPRRTICNRRIGGAWWVRPGHRPVLLCAVCAKILARRQDAASCGRCDRLIEEG